MDAAKILIVDDQIHALQGVSRIMRGAGYEVLESANGTDCLRLAAEHKPDLILLDVVLPDIDGMEVCRRIKSDPETANICVVLLSSIHTESDSQAKGLEYGADGYIARPIPNRELVARVKSILRLKYAAKEEIYQMFIDSAPAAMAMFDRDMRYLAASRRWMTDYSLGDRDVLGQSHYEIFPEIPDHWKDVHQRGLQGEVIKVDEEEFKRQDGSILWLRWEVRPWHWAEGQIGGIIIFTEDITDRKRAEDQYRQFIETCNEGFWTMGGDHCTTLVNKKMADMLGYGIDEIIGKKVEHFMFAEDIQDHETKMALRHQGQVEVYERRFRRKDGTTLWTLVSATAIMSQDGRFSGSFAMFTDITNRKQAEERLRKVQLELEASRDNYRSLYDYAPIGYFTLTKQGVITQANMQGIFLLGMPRSKLIGKNFGRFITPESQNQWYHQLLEAQIDGVTHSNDFWLKRQDGSTSYVSLKSICMKVSTNPFVENKNELVVLVAATDITDRELAQEELTKSEEKFSKVFNSAPIPMTITIVDDGTYVDVNDKFTELSGLSREECIGKTSVELGWVSPEDRMRLIEDLQAHGNVRSMDINFFTKDKRELKCIYNGDFIQTKNRQLLLSTAEDVTESKRIEKELVESEQRYKNLYRTMMLMCDNVPDLIWAKDLDRKFTFVNRAMCEKLLLASDTMEPIGKDDMFFVNRARRSHPNNPNWHTFGEICVDSDAVVMNTQQPEQFHEFGNVKGQPLYLDVYKTPFLNEQGEMIGTVGCGRDVTDKKKSEELLRRSEEKFRTMFERHNAVMLLIDPISGSIIDANNAAERFYGYTKSQLSSMFIQDINMLPPAEVENERNLASQEQRNYFIFPHRLADGKVRTVEVHSSPIEQNGKILLFSIIYDITERELAENSLRESEDKFAKVFNYAPVLITLSNIDDGTYVDVNDKFCEVSGFTREESIGKTSVELGWISPEDRMLLIEDLQANRSVRAMDLKLLTKDKREIQCIYNGELIQAQNGQMLLSIAHDITERKRMEILLKEINAFLDKLIDAIPLPIFYKDTNGLFVGFNKSFEEFYGKTRQELIGKSVFDIYPEELAKVYYAKDNELFCNPGVQVYETPIQDGRGVVHDIIFHKSTYLDSQGHVKGLIGVILDVTERKHMEDALRESALRLNRAEIIAGTGYWEIDLSTKKVTASNGARTIYGVGEQELTLNDIQKFPLPEYRPLLNEALLALIKDGEPYDIEFKIKRANDNQLLDIHSIAHYDHEKNSVFGTIHDITDIRHAEERHSQLFAAIEQAAEGVVITSPTGIIQYVNPAEETISGYGRDELIGHAANIFKSDKHGQDFYTSMRETINSGKVWSGRFINRKKDGTEYKEDTSISPVYNKSGHLTNFVAVKHDVTKQIEIQEQLFQAQKMEAIGTLAGGFAHDFNNKLQVIAGYVELILFNKDLPETLISELDQINQTVVGCTELIKGMMVFSRKTPIGLQPIAINKIVEQTRSMLTRSIPKMIEIELSLADDIWSINAVSNQIDQILTNLAINARDAMPDGGKITIKTKNIVLDEEFCRRNPKTKPGKYALITVSDTGTGMNQDTASHIFEPFFTTKEAGKGTGLGLAVVYGIVEQHGGRIICDSEPSVGTTFSIYLPAIEELPQEQCSEKKEPPRGRGETILLVDDEPDITKLVSLWLNKANYSVITASNGEEALELYEKHREGIKLIILDIVMPKMDGSVCLRTLLTMEPKIKVLVVSGELNEGMAKDSKEAGAKGFIRKPFDMPELLTTIREVLDMDIPGHMNAGDGRQEVS